MRDGITNAVGRPLGAVAKALLSPTAAGRHRPLYPLNVIDTLRGGSLEDAVAGRVVMVTGASSGIGATTAIRIGAAGGEVVLVARGLEKLEETAAKVRTAGGVAHVYPCDLSDLDAVATLAADVQADLGRVDVLINDAGRSIRRSLELSYERMHDYQRTMQLNCFSPVQLMLKLLPRLRCPQRKGETHCARRSPPAREPGCAEPKPASGRALTSLPRSIRAVGTGTWYRQVFGPR